MIPLMTLAVAFLGGLLFNAFNIPLGWLLGAMLFVALGNLPKSNLSIPRSWRSPATMIIGTIVGSLVSIELLPNIYKYLPTISAMLIFQCVLIGLGTLLFYVFFKLDKHTAFFSSFPGGVSQISAISLNYNCNQPLIALNHACRLFVVISFIPIAITFIGNDILANSNIGAGLETPKFINYLWPLIAGGVGYWIARRLHIITPALYGPMLLTGVLCLLGIIPEDLKVGEYLVIAAQIIIGVSVGMKFNINKTTYKAIAGIHLPFALTLLICTLSFSYLAHKTFDIASESSLMIMSPGGLSEMILISYTLGIDTVMVTTHHIVRSLFLLFTIPWILHFLNKKLHTEVSPL